MQQKVIICPLVAVLVAFLAVLFGVEYQFKQVWEQQLQSKLKTITSSTLQTIAQAEPHIDASGQYTSFQEILRRHVVNDDLRLSVYNEQGRLLADSSLNLASIKEHQSSVIPTEIQVAKIKGEATLRRTSDVTQEPIIVVASFDKNTGYIVRVMMSNEAYANGIFEIQKGFIALASALCVALLLFGCFVNRLVNRTLAEERELQESRIEERTREINLIQTMTTMLNAGQNFDEIGQVVLNILPRITPALSGKLYLLNDQDKLEVLVSWGKAQDEKVTVIRAGNEKVHDNEQVINESYQPTATSHLICVDLIDEQELFGVIHFLGAKNVVHDTAVRKLVMQLSEQISLGLANLRVKDKLRHQAIRDPLTNLYNRRFMLESLEQALNRAERHQLTLALLMIDLDHFKSFNDTFGHKVGDIVLTEVAKLFNENLRLEDIACRFGGEEFCIICPDTGLKDAYTLAEKLRITISGLTLSEEGQDYGKVTISTGIAIYPNHANNAQQMITQADKALYEAKNRGRNTTAVAKSNATEHLEK